MPLKSAQSQSPKSVSKAISFNVKELKKDNLKQGKEKGAQGKPRSQKQIIAIALSAAKRNKK
jgi:hypothetical protein